MSRIIALAALPQLPLIDAAAHWHGQPLLMERGFRRCTPQYVAGVNI